MCISKEKLLDKANNSVYKLVILAAKRATEIQAGQPVLLETPKSDNPATITLKEIAAGLVCCKNREEHHKDQVSQMAKEGVPTYSRELKMYTPFTGTEIVNDNEKEGKIIKRNPQIHQAPEDDNSNTGQG